MEEPTEFVDFIKDRKMKNIEIRQKLSLATNIFIIILFLSIGFYVVKNVEYFKQAGDVCKVCYEKTQELCEGKTNCYNKYFTPAFIEEEVRGNILDINISDLIIE